MLCPDPRLRAGDSAGVHALCSRRIPPWALEVLLLALLFLAYRLARIFTTGDIGQAVANAESLRELERWLGLPDEAALQKAFLALPGAVHGANHYYVWLHFPITALFLLWAYARRPAAQYRWARQLIVTQTGLALLVQWLFPLAPPRMLAGFVDTMSQIGPSAYDGVFASVANQYAAMPSLHVGWSVLVAVVVWRTVEHPIRKAAVVHAALTAVVVIATAYTNC